MGYRPDFLILVMILAMRWSGDALPGDGVEIFSVARKLSHVRSQTVANGHHLSSLCSTLYRGERVVFWMMSVLLVSVDAGRCRYQRRRCVVAGLTRLRLRLQRENDEKPHQ